jgi:hypothetical protein
MAVPFRRDDDDDGSDDDDSDNREEPEDYDGETGSHEVMDAADGRYKFRFELHTTWDGPAGHSRIKVGRCSTQDDPGLSALGISA